MTNLYRQNNILDIQNNILPKVEFVVTTGPLTNQVISYTNIRYDKWNDILYYDYSFQHPVEVQDGFDFNEYLSTLLKTYLAFKQ